MLTLQKSLSSRSLVDSSGRRKVTCHGDGMVEICHQRVTCTFDRGCHSFYCGNESVVGLSRMLSDNQLRYVFRNANGDCVGEWCADLPEECRVITARCSGRRTYRREFKPVPGIPFDEWFEMCAEATIMDPETEAEEVPLQSVLTHEALHELYSQLLHESSTYGQYTTDDGHYRAAFRRPTVAACDNIFDEQPITWTTTDVND